MNSQEKDLVSFTFVLQFTARGGQSVNVRQNEKYSQLLSIISKTIQR